MYNFTTMSHLNVIVDNLFIYYWSYFAKVKNGSRKALCLQLYSNVSGRISKSFFDQTDPLMPENEETYAEYRETSGELTWFNSFRRGKINCI